MTKTTQTHTHTHAISLKLPIAITIAMDLEEFYVASNPPLSPSGVEEVVASLRELNPVSSHLSLLFHVL